MSIRPNRQNSIRVGRPKSRPTGLYVVLMLSLLANIYFVLRWQPPESESEDAPEGAGGLTAAAIAVAEAVAEKEVATGAKDAVPGEPAEKAPANEKVQGAAEEVPAGVAGDAAAAPVAQGKQVSEATVAAVAPAVAQPVELPPGSRHLQVVVQGTVSRAFEKALGAQGARLAIVASRLLVWNLDLTRDPRKGDTVDVVYSPSGDSDGFTIHALRYRSAKFNRTFDAYRFEAKGRAFASYYDADGREVPARLKSSPIERYESITSLIGDGRDHLGMDFKAPVGSAVVAPWEGHVLRTNWNHKFNGNSIELRSLDGRRVARFLHLDKLSAQVKVGARLKKGQRLASSGNTGRSFAPHLHYELSDGSGRVLDPLEVHDTHHPRLQGQDLAVFKRAIGNLGAGLSGERATGGQPG